MEEIRVGNKDLIVKNNLVKSPVIPQTTAELKRNIIVEGEADFAGAVYGNSVLVHNGPVTFRKAVFGKDEVNVDLSAKGRIMFLESVGSAEAVSCGSSTVSIFGSDINTKKIVLKNCFVGGSLYAEDISLDHCVVIGGVFASKSMTVNNSIVGTFNSQAVTMSGDNFLIYPSAFSVEPIEASSNSTLVNITLVDLMGLYKGQIPKEGTGFIRMNVKQEKQRTNLKADDGTVLLVNSYSVAGRVLAADMATFENLDNHFLINAASLSSQLMKSYTVKNEETDVDIPLELTKIAAFFFDILDGRIELAEIDGRISFDDLKKRFDV